jgi:hypothetical protein
VVLSASFVIVELSLVLGRGENKYYEKLGKRGYGWIVKNYEMIFVKRKITVRFTEN